MTVQLLTVHLAQLRGLKHCLNEPDVSVSANWVPTVHILSQVIVGQVPVIQTAQLANLLAR